MKLANLFYLWLQLSTIAKTFAFPLSDNAHAPFYPLCDVI